MQDMIGQRVARLTEPRLPLLRHGLMWREKGGGKGVRTINERHRERGGGVRGERACVRVSAAVCILPMRVNACERVCVCACVCHRITPLSPTFPLQPRTRLIFFLFAAGDLGRPPAIALAATAALLPLLPLLPLLLLLFTMWCRALLLLSLLLLMVAVEGFAVDGGLVSEGAAPGVTKTERSGPTSRPIAACHATTSPAGVSRWWSLVVSPRRSSDRESTVLTGWPL